VKFTSDVDQFSERVLTVVPRALGPRVGGQVQQVIKAVKAGDWSLVDGAPVAAGVTLLAGEYELRLVAADADNSAPLPGNAGVVVLDTTVTPALAAEGLARDVVRVVQQARRDAHLDVSDRVAVVVAGGDGVRSAVAEHRDFVAREVLASTIDLTEGDLDGFEGEVGVGERITVTVTRV
jgi:isoleucyl-tRNA synthetase